MIRTLAIIVALVIALGVTLIVLTLRDNPARAAIGESHLADNSGIKVQYFVRGPAQAEPVILLPSYARAGSDFNELVAALNQAGYRSIVLQARGIGDSDLPGLDVSLFDYADDLAAVLDQEQLTTPVTVVGHAFGNRVARAFSSRYPKRVRSLVLLAAGDAAPPPATRNDIFKILANTLPESIRAGSLQRAFFAPGNAAPTYWMEGWYPRAGLAQGNATATTPQDQWIGGGTAPILVVQPSHDAAAAQGANKLLSLYPQRVTVVPLDNAGHAVLPEQPEQVARIVLEHLAARRDPLAGTSLYDDVVQYASLGDHRTGGAGDRATTEWLLDEMQAAGFAVEPQVFGLTQFFPGQQSLMINEQSIQAFPHWFPRATQTPVTAPLASFGEASLSGRIAYLAPDKAGPWYKLRPAQLAEEATARGALALVIAAPHPSNDIYVTNASPPHLQAALAIPTVVVAARDHGLLQQAIRERQTAVLTSNGESRQVEARNLLARYPAESLPGRPWVVISTPTSGWFSCAGERGSGVALWLGLARWIASQGPAAYNWLFVANSGHELDFMGAHHSLAAMPPPHNVRLWLHLGASIAARQWREEQGELVPLDVVHHYNRMYGDAALLPLINSAFSPVPDLEILPTSALNRGHSELGSIANAGYTALGMVGSHRFFHTPADTARVTDAALLAPYGEALKKFVDALDD